MKTFLKFLGGHFGLVLDILKSAAGAFSISFDLFLDCRLLIVLYGQPSTEQLDLSHIVFYAMASVIILPILHNYCGLFKNKSSKQKILAFCGFPMFPFVTQFFTVRNMCRQALVQLEIHNLTMTMSSSSSSILANRICETADELWVKIEKLEEFKSVLNKQRLLETSAEGQPQSYIKGILLLLTLSLTPNAYIPETIFGKSIEFFGIPSTLILLGFTLHPILMNINYYLGTLYEKRTTVGSVLLVFIMFACLLGKFVSIVAVFSPPLGLFSILGHWKKQQIPFSCAVMSPPNGDGFYYSKVL